MKRARFNLVLVIWAPHERTEADLHQIAKRVTEVDPKVRAFVVQHHKIDQLKLLRTWSQPTLSLSLYCLDKRKLLPGRFVNGQLLNKHGEYARLDAAGIPVPQWTVITPDTRLDPAEWGPYIVEKPSAGRRGAQVRIRKASRIRYVAPESLPQDHLGREGPMLAQRFIYTGEWPTSFRVITMFGKVLLCYRQVSSRGQPLTGRWNFKATGGISIVSNTIDMHAELVQDDEVIALAERAHRAAFADFPMLGFDIIRDAETGTCYVLECHAQGNWLFATDMGLGIQSLNKIDFRSQFNYIDRAAEILAQETVHRAAVSWPPLVWGDKSLNG
jgi:hypothetical protein